MTTRLLILAMALAACSGQIDGEAAREPGSSGQSASSGQPPPVGMTPPPRPTSAACANGAPRPGVGGLRRLTRLEYDNTVAELLGDTSSPGAAFPADQVVLGFDNAVGARPSTLLVEQYEAAAERLAANVSRNLPALMGCTPRDAAAEDACLRQFVSAFGLRAYRRPLAADEVERYVGFYAANKTPHGFAPAVKMVVQAMLQSPFFLYRVEGVTDPAAGGVVKASPFELATRLSYLIWSSMPDKALFDAARAGSVSTPAEVAAQAQRMLADGRASQGIRNFFGQWLHLSAIDKVDKDPTTFPKWKASLGPLLKQESEAFVQELVLRGEGTVSALLKAPYTYLNAELAAFYGVTGATGGAFQKVSLDPTRRAGVLTQGAFLASTAHPRQTNPVARGVFVREKILCSPPPTAPGMIPPFPEPDGRLNTRERLAQHRDVPACAACHALFDPLGLAFEHYDGIGLWRDRDAGKPVDASGEIVAVEGLNGRFDGAIALVDRLADSQQVRACVAKEYFRFAFGRAEDSSVDQCTIETLQAALMSGGGSFKQLMTTLVQTDPFMYRPTGSR